VTEFDPQSIPQAWGTYDDAERLRRWAFLRKTPGERLSWMVEMLEIAYATGARQPAARAPTTPPALCGKAATPMDPADRQAIEHFVRTTLGCKCPVEVFQSIEIERAHTPGAALPHTRLVIGDRLLIYVVEAQPAKATAAAVSALATQGRAERDAKRYSRYRLVIASDHPTQFLTDAGTSFANAAGADNRAHLHVLATDQLPDAIRFDGNAIDPGAC